MNNYNLIKQRVDRDDYTIGWDDEEDNFVSDCCRASEDGELDDYQKDAPLGMCNDCKEMTTFHLESKDDPNL